IRYSSRYVDASTAVSRIVRNRAQAHSPVRTGLDVLTPEPHGPCNNLRAVLAVSIRVVQYCILGQGLSCHLEFGCIDFAGGDVCDPADGHEFIRLTTVSSENPFTATIVCRFCNSREV